jgi:peroxiredoxin
MTTLCRHPGIAVGPDLHHDLFLVDADGKVAKIWRKVKPEAHAADVLAAAKALGK